MTLKEGKVHTVKIRNKLRGYTLTISWEDIENVSLSDQIESAIYFLNNTEGVSPDDIESIETFYSHR